LPSIVQHVQHPPVLGGIVIAGLRAGDNELTQQRVDHQLAGDPDAGAGRVRQKGAGNCGDEPVSPAAVQLVELGEDGARPAAAMGAS
jgi:hypothetical protein